MKAFQSISTWASALLLVTVQLAATPPVDPVCAGAPSTLQQVQAARDQLRAEQTSRRRTVSLLQAARAPRLTLERPDAVQPPLLTLEGAPGQMYHLEAAFDLASPRWTPWLSFVPGDQPLRWSDGALMDAPAQFFRLRSGPVDTLGDSVSNFRLLDHTGVARDLYYHTHLQSIAILAAGTNIDQVASSLPLLDELAGTYTNKTEIWILLSDPAPVRSHIVAQARSLKVNFPVLLDTHGLAARSVGLETVGEVVVVKPPAFTTVYRGKVAASTPSTSPDSLLGQALASVDGSRPLTFSRTPVHGPRLAHTLETVPAYADRIAPTLHQYCAPCHRGDGVAPFALTSYSVVQEWAPAIKHAVLSGKMPPWHADPEYGRFANDLSLPGPLKSDLVRWIDAGAPRGTGPDPLTELPAPASYDRWPAELGEPDALVTIPLQSIKASGSEPYRYLYVQTPNPTNVWLRAAVVRPSNHRAVHHYLVWLGRIGNSGSPDNSTYRSHIAEFVPGYQPLQLPADSGIFLGRSNWLTFNLHYNPYGIQTNDQPTLALWFHKERPKRTWNVTGLADTRFSILPQARDHEVQAEWTTPSRVTLHRFNPHMHVRGKRMKYEAIYPGGNREVLLSVPDYDFNWQIGYDLAEPKEIPAGTRIVASGAFDNSPQNLANPDPSATVRWGDQSWMEMFIGYIDYTE